MDGSICKIKGSRLTCCWTRSLVTGFAGCFFLACGVLGFWKGSAIWHDRSGKPVSPWLHYLLFAAFLAYGSAILFLRRRVVIDPVHDSVEISYRFIVRFRQRRYPLSSFKKVVLRKDPEDTRYCYEVLLVGPHVTIEAGAHQRPAPAVRMAETIAEHSGLAAENLQ